MFTVFIGIQDWQWLGNCLHLAPQNWTLDREVAHVSIGSSPSSETFLPLNLFIGTHPSNSWTPGHSVYIQIHSINMFSFCLTLPGLDITCCITCSTLQVRHHFAPSWSWRLPCLPHASRKAGIASSHPRSSPVDYSMGISPEFIWNRFIGGTYHNKAYTRPM
jgi:hypothetical protein